MNALLIDAPVNRHFAQLHTDSADVTESVALYVETGLRRNNGVLAILGATHKDMLLDRLTRSGLDPASLRRSGQLHILDAQPTLQRIMRGPMPDWDAFRPVAGKAIEGVQAFGLTTVRLTGSS